ncbi:hypothetical protein I4U23_028267 [Adineta vaga]|nr:hypothetical protein I4U23_028267 [Adineta vaga]
MDSVLQDLTLVFENVSYQASLEFYTVHLYDRILKICENLEHLSYIGSYPHYYPGLKLTNVPFTSFSSSTLNKLSIRLKCFDDCLALLDGRLKQLMTLIIVIESMEYDSSNDDLPNMKCFSLTTTSYCLTNVYDNHFLPFLRRMSNIEELTLHITIKNRTVFIDGTHIYNEILIHMPRIHLFNCYICTEIISDDLIHYLSKDDIQQTLNNIEYQEMDCLVNYRYSTAICYLFSLPFLFEEFTYMGNTFSNIIFNYVKRLSVKDDIPFKHDFFHEIAQCFPLLESLCIINTEPQSVISYTWNKINNECYPVVQYPNLTSLHLETVHIDYVEQFLNEFKTDLPCLTELTVNYDHLSIVTEDFTRDATWTNCMKVKTIQFGENVELPNQFYVYFSSYYINETNDAE